MVLPSINISLGIPFEQYSKSLIFNFKYIHICNNKYIHIYNMYILIYNVYIFYQNIEFSFVN